MLFLGIQLNPLMIWRTWQWPVFTTLTRDYRTAHAHLALARHHLEPKLTLFFGIWWTCGLRRRGTCSAAVKRKAPACGPEMSNSSVGSQTVTLLRKFWRVD